MLENDSRDEMIVSDMRNADCGLEGCNQDTGGVFGSGHRWRGGFKVTVEYTSRCSPEIELLSALSAANY